MKFTILHISDLHRDPANPIPNNALLDSLERDRERYRKESPPIGDPSLAIVSGDIIYGIPADCKDPDLELAKQYDEAEDFLVKLANSFLGGDKKRIVLVPGNHDVSMSHTMRSMKRVDPTDPAKKELLRSWAENRSLPSPLRWSWKELCFYEIKDNDLYLGRFKAFCEFNQRFYGGGSHFGLEPQSQYHIFDYPEFNLSIAAFSSCCNNDPLNQEGLIHPECIAQAAHELRQSKYLKRIRAAVWHHNTSGPPSRSDYLDSNILQVLIDCGFTIGFHGHQHKAQFIDESFQFGSGRKITVLSAGTLCGGPKALPSGHARAYNLLEIDTNSLSARLHARSMQNDMFEQPIWASGRLAKSQSSFVDFEIQRPADSDRAQAIEMGDAEKLVRTKQFTEAVTLLKPLAPTVPLARRLLLECYTNLENHEELIRDFYPPIADNEIIFLADAFWAENRKTELAKMLELESVRTNTNVAVANRVKHYLERLRR